MSRKTTPKRAIFFFFSESGLSVLIYPPPFVIIDAENKEVIDLKRIIALILFAALCLTCAACSKREQDASSGGGSEINSSAYSSQPDPSSSGAEPLIVKLDLGELAGAESLDEIFDYGNGLLGAVITKTVDDEQQTVLRFIDTNYGTLLTDEYVVGGAGFIATVDRGNLHYICFEENSVAISGDPHGNLNVEQSDFLFRYDSDDNLLYSIDGEWYACREEDAVVVNVESNEDFTPYVGFHDPEDFENNTASAPAGFTDDYFIFNVIGYEWPYGYGVYNMKTGETQLFDQQYGVYVSPAKHHKTNRVPYNLDHDGFGYIELSDPGKQIPLFDTQNPFDGDEPFRAVFGDSYYFTAESVAGGKYLGVLGETPDNGMAFAAYDFQTFKKVCEHRDPDFCNGYVFCGNAAAFQYNSIDYAGVTVITLP